MRARLLRWSRLSVASLARKRASGGAYERIGADLVGVLKQTPGPVAASRLRDAVFSPFENIRSSAAVALKDRPLDHYVPLMLSWLATPIEANFVLVRDSYGQPIIKSRSFERGR